jgi:hypothetical protein
MKEFAMDNQPEISAHHWILALAIGVIVSLLVSGWNFSEIQSGMGILAIADHKLNGDVDALRQEVAGQRAEIASLKASLAEAKVPHAAAVDSTPAAESHGPKPKPHR